MLVSWVADGGMLRKTRKIHEWTPGLSFFNEFKQFANLEIYLLEDSLFATWPITIQIKEYCKNKLDFSKEKILGELKRVITHKWKV